MIFTLFFITSSLAAQCPSVVKETEAIYQKKLTVSADFEQKTFSKALGIEEVSRGHVKLQRPNKIRWETASPSENLLVSDGKKFWYYTPPFNPGEPGQLIERKASSEKSKLAYALLAGRFSTMKEVSCQKIDNQTVLLTPKKGSAGTVQKLQVRFNTQNKDKKIEWVEINHENGDRVSIRLSKVTLGEKMDSKTFKFERQKNTLTIPGH